MEKDKDAQNEQTALAARAVTALLSVMQTLAQAMERENDALATQAFSSLPSLQQEKARLVRDYRAALAALLPLASESGETLSVAERTRLKQGGERFAAALKDNAERLRTAVSATQAIVQMVVGKAREQAEGNPCYSDLRKGPVFSSGYSPICNPVAISKTA